MLCLSNIQQLFLDLPAISSYFNSPNSKLTAPFPHSRLYTKGRVFGHKHTKCNTQHQLHPNLRHYNAQFYLRKRIVYVYHAKGRSKCWRSGDLGVCALLLYFHCFIFHVGELTLVIHWCRHKNLGVVELGFGVGLPPQALGTCVHIVHAFTLCLCSSYHA